MRLSPSLCPSLYLSFSLNLCVRVYECSQQNAYTLQIEIISAMNYACIYVQINTLTVYFRNKTDFNEIMDFCSRNKMHTSKIVLFRRLLNEHISSN